MNEGNGKSLLNILKHEIHPKNPLFSLLKKCHCDPHSKEIRHHCKLHPVNPYPTAFPYGNGMVLHFYQQQESSTTKTVHTVINKRLKTYV